MNNKINKLINYTIKNGGVSFNKNLEILEDLKGFTVSIQKFEYTTKIENIEEIKNNIQDKINILNKSIKNNYFIGLWLYDNILYIDINKIELNKSRALELGKKENQKAIFDNVNKKEIEVQKTNKTYILYEYIESKNDLQYIQEYFTKNEIIKALKICEYNKIKKCIYNNFNNNINNYIIRNNKKYIIIEDYI